MSERAGASARGVTGVAPRDRAPAVGGLVLPGLLRVAGVAWALAFVVIGLSFWLQLYGDGAIFSYGVAVRDGWAFHWHNIAGRVFVYLYAHVPAEALVALTRDPSAGVILYGLLFFSAPLVGLALTWVADPTKGRALFSAGCAATALFCPLVFGFPTEMWIAHGLFWPLLALAHRGLRGWPALALFCCGLLALVHTHGGGVLFGMAIVASLLLRDVRDGAFGRALAGLAAAVAVLIAVKAAFPPDAYFAQVVVRAALKFLDVLALADWVVIDIIGALAIYGLAYMLLARWLGERQGLVLALAASVLAVVAYNIWFDDYIHAADRYALRTSILLGTPILAAIAVVLAYPASDVPPAWVRWLAGAASAVVRGMDRRMLAGAFAVVMVCHAIETVRFVSAWEQYKARVVRLATGTAFDPSVGDRGFVSAHRITGPLDALAWQSTTHYLSVLLAPGYKPQRLVVDPDAGYYWLSCGVASASETAPRAVPRASRALITRHACLNRPE